MIMCAKHWGLLRQAITDRGLWPMVPASGEESVKRLAEEISGKPQTKANFDPLMSAHNMILVNAVDTITLLGADRMCLLAPPEDHPEWGCPICYLNFLSEQHDQTCTDPNCKKEKGLTFDCWIDKAADGSQEHAKTLPDEAAPSSDEAVPSPDKQAQEE